MNDTIVERCPCVFVDIDPEMSWAATGDELGEVCACGHAADEHAEDGACLIDQRNEP